MARRRFFVGTVDEGEAELTGDDGHHLARVLRAETGQRFEISDGRGLYLAEIVKLEKASVRFRVVEQLETGAPLPPLTLYMALIKFDRFEWAVEKATELGVGRIIPVQCARTEQGLMAASVKRAERWRKIARESSQQSRRVSAPDIAEACRVDSLPESGYRCRMEESAGAPPLWDVLASADPGQEYGLLIGPEGGWTDVERTQLGERGWQPASLGPLVLRAETAAIGALAIAAEWMRTRHAR